MSRLEAFSEAQRRLTQQLAAHAEHLDARIEQSLLASHRYGRLNFPGPHPSRPIGSHRIASDSISVDRLYNYHYYWQSSLLFS